MLRRILVHGNKLGLTIQHISDLVRLITQKLKPTYTQLETAQDHISTTIIQEAEKFAQVLTKGMREFEKAVKDNTLSGENIFMLQATHGLPFEVIVELGEQKNIIVDKVGYRAEVEKHKDISRQ